jgi:hypothetical protein
MIRATKANLEEVDLVPQAIFGRPIFFFTRSFVSDYDDLDHFVGADFCLNNEVIFCLRCYRGHDQKTVTLYLTNMFRLDDEIKEASDRIIDGFHLPIRAVRWRRGDPFQFGVLQDEMDRLREAEARDLALKIAASCDGYAAATSYIKETVPEYIELTTVDLQPSPSRPREKRWQQVVGNVVSHKGTGRSIFSRQLAEKTADGIRVTNLGLTYLDDIGYSPKRAL